MVMNITNEEFIGVTLVIGDTMEMMFEVAMGVMDMEDDKVADMALKIPNEDFTDGTVVIDGTIRIFMKYKDIFPRNIAHQIKFRTNTSGSTWWSNLELIQVAQPGGQI